MKADQLIEESEGITEKDTEELQLQAKTNLTKCIKKEVKNNGNGNENN